ncbi:MAG: riboflavin biosynthesis protein RibF [Tepidisphaeraceae bacterium]
MEFLEGLEGLRSVPDGAALTIGNYDGVHVGHVAIIRHLQSIATGTPAGRPAGRPLVLATFEPHPLTVLRPQLAPPRLTPVETKNRLLADLGIDYLVTLPPTPSLLNLTAEAFWGILRDDVRPACIVEGPRFNFGKGRGGSIEKLVEWAQSTPIHVHQLPGVERALNDRTIVTVSSSMIRWLLGYGRVEDAAICLGRAYELRGTVVQGFQRGRTIGVPTANLQCGDQLVPADGVYAGAAEVNGQTYPAAISIGTAPTFEVGRYQVEVHLIGFTGDLYGQTLHVRLTRWLRDQMKFPGPDALIAQLQRDLAAARNPAPGCDASPHKTTQDQSSTGAKPVIQ